MGYKSFSRDKILLENYIYFSSDKKIYKQVLKFIKLH